MRIVCGGGVVEFAVEIEVSGDASFVIVVDGELSARGQRAIAISLEEMHHVRTVFGDHHVRHSIVVEIAGGQASWIAARGV